ncbi:hexosaminidase D-like isoform X3 [Musca autumnalis]|uniref:hexosaminidase D-like isoform X1 n=2 Tax=Musca autumnalis TaxID=221902 RepID=UPI003CEEA765
MMHTNIFILVWRRKISLLLLLSSFLLFGLWTWAYLDTNPSYQQGYGGVNNIPDTDADGIAKDSYKHIYVLQKLISQANRVLRFQQESSNNKISTKSKKDLRSQTHPNSLANSGLGRFLKPTKNPTSIVIEEASAQTLSLVARRKKGPIVGESYLFEEERLKILENQQRVRNSAMDEIQNQMENEAQMLSSAERQTQYEHELQRMGIPVVAGIGPDGAKPPHERLVHFDLKGAPPKISFLKQLLPVMKTLGATGLLIEYEDMFPFEGNISTLSAKNAYNREELRDFLETCAHYGFSVMPLVQTFGHLEYALKLQEFASMRELPDSPQSICPSQKSSLYFIEAMLTQVVEFHLQVESLKMTHIHIGCDEVARMGECVQCRQKTKGELFMNHVINVAHFVRNKWEHLKVVIWDDMLRGMTLSEMQHSQIGQYVEPMIWVYINDIYRFIPPMLWERYTRVFPTAWAASAFKGAFGESLMIPPIQNHLENNIRWLAVIAKEGGRFSKGFQGLALTGWQRYDHFAVLCELLPTGIPSLMVSLSTVSKGYFETNPKENDLLKVLQCVYQLDKRRSGHPWLDLQPNSHHNQLFSTCVYLGHQFYKYSLRLYGLLSEIQMYLNQVQEHSAWMSDYNVRHNFSSPIRVHELTQKTPIYISELQGMSRQAQELLYEIFDKYTIAEFIEQTIYPTIGSLQRHLANAQLLLQPNHWPQRPLPIAQALHDLHLMSDEPHLTAGQSQQHQQQVQAQTHRHHHPHMLPN